MARRNADEYEDAPTPVPIDTEPIEIDGQVALAKRLQAGLLNTYLTRLQNGTLSDTGLSALQRLLAANGWSIDPAQLPKGLKDLLTSSISAEDIDDEDGILPFRSKQA